jgi:tol-pal system protein YbgF
MSDQQAYDAAFELIQARQYQDGSTAFTSFLLSYPTSVLRDNAQYWLAETYYVQREFAAALPEFERVIGSYPQSAKLPDALLKIGYCNYELKNWDAARQALTQVTRLYPDTTAARLAEQRLSRIAAEVG